MSQKTEPVIDKTVIEKSELPEKSWKSELTKFARADNQPIGIIGEWAAVTMASAVISQSGTRIDELTFEGEFYGDTRELTKKLCSDLGGELLSIREAYSPDDMAVDSVGNLVDTGIKRNASVDFAIVWDHAITWGTVTHSNWVDIHMLSMDYQLSQKIVDVCGEILHRRVPKRDFYMLTRSDSGYELTAIKSKPCPLIRGNYEPPVVEAIDHVLEEMNSQDPCGRLVILEGQPGTGKTYLVRGLVNETKDATMIVFPPNLLREFSGPGVVTAFLNFRARSSGPMVLVLEDGDECLATRQLDNAASISELLSLGDGILGSALDIRLIITTNVKKMDFDPAALRTGRLCRLITVDKLSIPTVQKIFEREGVEGGPTKNALTLADVYSHVKNRQSKSTETKTMGFKRD